EGPYYHGAYGFRLRRHYGLDQLDRACEALRRNPDGRQVVLQIWDPTLDLPHDDGSPQAPDIPCNLLSMLKGRGGKLEWVQVMRSNDLFRGMPYNFVQFTTLHEVMAGWLGVELGSYHQLSDSLHYYVDECNCFVDNPATCVMRNTDSLMLPREESEAA